MNCTGFRFRFWRRKPLPSEKKDGDITSRPLHDSVISTDTAFSDIEKPLIATGRSNSRSAPLPSTIASLRPRANPTLSAYSAPAHRQEDGSGDDSDGDSIHSRPKGSDATLAGSLSSTEGSYLSQKLKEETVDDPEKERRRKAEAARRKAEKEEQDRLDFFQLM